MKGTPPVWEDAYTVESFSADWTGLATVQFLCQAMQETAWHHAQRIGYGTDLLKERGIVWVLTKLQLRMNAFPCWNDKFTVRTWYAKKEKLLFHRDFEILDAQSDVLANATTAWLAIDIERRRPVRVADIDSHAEPNDRARAVKEPWQRLPDLTEPAGDQPFSVFARDLDMSGHVNNANYAEWLLEPLSIEFRAGHELETLDVSYQAEAGHGDVLLVQLQPYGDGGFLHRIVRPADNKIVCAGRSQWVQRSHPRTPGWSVAS